MKMTYNSKMNKLKSGSMITVIPKPIVDLLEYKSGDTLEWNVKFEDNKVSVTVKKVD